MNRHLRFAIVALTLCLCATAAGAQSYPSGTVTIVASATPGGVTDLLARLLAKKFGEAWGQPVIVENRPGANNQLAAEFVAHSKPDGHTLFVTPDRTFVTNPLLYRKLSYDAQNGFVPISGLVRASHALVANPNLPAKDLKQLVELAKSKPGQINYGTWGPASAPHLSMEYLKSLAGIDIVPVHYKGATQALTDVVAGHIQMMFMDIGNVLEPARAGRLKLLGIATPKRLPEFPDWPALSETLPGFEATFWVGLFAPRGTPDAIIAQVNTDTRKALADPAIKAQALDAQHLQAFAGPPEELARYIVAERAKWGDVIKKANIPIN
jgi:tripartite-type tricarboxylate transporter receptor subunit TctC